jgi:hypothetical protein
MLINLSADGQILRFLADDDGFVELLIAKVTVRIFPALCSKPVTEKGPIHANYHHRIKTSQMQTTLQCY